MERAIFSLLFYIRRTKLNRHGEAPILMRIAVNGVRADASIKKTILPQLWDADKGRAVDKKREEKELNLYLDAIYGRVLKIQRDMEIEGDNVTASKVLARYLGKGDFIDRSLFDIFREHNEKCRKLVGISMADATAQRYETTLKAYTGFCVGNLSKERFSLE